MTDAPEVGRYPTRLGHEQFLIFNSRNDLQLIIIEPILEERNFLRRTVVELARALAPLGIDSFIPDLPGCGDSIQNIHDVRFEDWRSAIADAARWIADQRGAPVHIASLRGGALLDDAAVGASWWRFAPASGADLLRPLRRASLLSENDGSLAGYALQPDMLEALDKAVPNSPPGACHECLIEGAPPPLWRRAEPGEDPGLVAALADDLAQWVRQCAAA